MHRLSASRRCITEYKHLCRAPSTNRPIVGPVWSEISRPYTAGPSNTDGREDDTPSATDDAKPSNGSSGEPSRTPEQRTPEQLRAKFFRDPGKQKKRPRQTLSKKASPVIVEKPIDGAPLRDIPPHKNPGDQPSFNRESKTIIRRRWDIVHMPPHRYGPTFINHIKKRSRQISFHYTWRADRTKDLHFAQVKDVLVSSANALLASGKMVEGAPELYDVSTIWKFVADDELWETGIKAYDCSPTDLLRWRNALASGSLSEAVIHLFPLLKTDRKLFYGEQERPCPPPGWLFSQLVLYRTHTTQDVAIGLRIAISALRNPHVFPLERWKLGLIVLRQICAYNLTHLLHDCITYMLMQPMSSARSKESEPPVQEVTRTSEDITKDTEEGPEDPIQAKIEAEARAVGTSTRALYSQMKFFLIVEALRQLPPSDLYTAELMRVLLKHEEAGFPLLGVMLKWIVSGDPAYGSEELVGHLLRRMEKNGYDPILSTLRFFAVVLSKRGNVEAVDKIMSKIADVVLSSTEEKKGLPIQERLDQFADIHPRYWPAISDSLAAYVEAARHRPEILEFIEELRSNTPQWNSRGRLWSTVLRTISWQKNVDLHKLIGISGQSRDPLEANASSEATRFPLQWSDVSVPDRHVPEVLQVLRTNRVAVVSVMARLLNAHQARAAIWLWQQVKEHMRNVDAYVLSVLIGALNDVNRLDLSYGIICKIAGFSVHPAIRTTVDYLWPSTKTGDMLDDGVFNSFISGLNRAGRFDVVGQVWNSMERHFGVRPTSWTLTLLITTGNYSDVLPSFTSEFAVLRDRLPFGPSRTDTVLSPTEIADALVAGQEMNASQFWDGQPPWRTAQRIFKEVLFGNFPMLKEMKSPVDAKRNSLHWLHPGSFTFKRTTTALRDLLSHLTLQGDLPVDSRFPDLYPDEYMFGAYISLLGRQSMTEEIPLALAWMRALDIKPHRRSLTLALMYYQDIGAPPPLLDRIVDQHGGNYEKLRQWIEEWVGPRETPQPAEVIRRKRAHLMGGWYPDDVNEVDEDGSERDVDEWATPGHAQTGNHQSGRHKPKTSLNEAASVLAALSSDPTQNPFKSPNKQ
ncbi:hypothetical protein CALVIDRAFT_75422 [Calocera viscosa TUFC12733]|uniref:Uncharacterized protein n=1 Tax=Calocera viscosa (strain TUFC12733) TaxID=1330018 RepID=A0A167NDM2_CALVF|nr:hypothetical protein CALVIDRAFT_75422 [Calocera viscosa TUFC12733]